MFSETPNREAGGTLIPRIPPVTESQFEKIHSKITWAARVAMAR